MAPDIDEEVLKKWFPPNDTQQITQEDTKGFLVCFHGACSDSSTFTSHGTSRRPMPNPLMKWAKENFIQIFGVNLPGRVTSRKDKRITTIEPIVLFLTEHLKKLVFDHCNDGKPFAFIGHSLGCYIIYELVCALRYLNMTLPNYLILSCCAPPNLPYEKRPWKPVHTLTSEELLQQAIHWNMNVSVSDSSIWNVYEPILRDDFTIIDSYVFSDNSVYRHLPKNSHEESKNYHAALSIPTTLVHGTQDKNVTESLMNSWRPLIEENDILSSSASQYCKIRCIEGNHNIFSNAASREAFMHIVVEEIHSTFFTHSINKS